MFVELWLVEEHKLKNPTMKVFSLPTTQFMMRVGVSMSFLLLLLYYNILHGRT